MAIAMPASPRTRSSPSRGRASLAPNSSTSSDRISARSVRGGAQTRIDADVERSADARQLPARFLDALLRDVRITIAATDEHRRSLQGPAEIPSAAGRPDETGGHAGHATVAARVATHELQRQASPLRKAEQELPRLWNAVLLQYADDRTHQHEGGRQMRLVALERRQERVGIPG